MDAVKGIAAALAKAQAEMGKAVKDTINPHFRVKYADLAAVMDACLPALNANGIAVVQPTGQDDAGRGVVRTILIHGSGETLECAVPLLLSKQDMQGYGSAVTYARRYGLMCMAGIAPEDDDGNEAAKSPVTEQPRQASEQQRAPFDATAATAAIIADIGAAADMDGLKAAWAKHGAAIKSVKAESEGMFQTITDAKAARVEALTSTEIPY